MIHNTIPINVDRNVSVKDYDEFHAKELLQITSTFYTFQGEGPYSGWPAFFIRLAGCNIGAKEDCEWCDTRFNFDEGNQFKFHELHSLISRHPHTKVVVLTGGEPLLQWRTLAPMIEEFQRERRFSDLIWQVETNGLLLREDHVNQMKGLGVVVVISPKIPHNKFGYRPIPSFLLKPGFILKYVVSADPTSPYFGIPDEARQASEKGIPVYVSGMTVYKRAPRADEIPTVWDVTLIDQAATAVNYMYAAKIALQYGLRVSYQTHLFGAQL